MPGGPMADDPHNQDEDPRSGDSHEQGPGSNPGRIATQQDFGRELTLARRRAGLTVREVARAAGIPASTAGDYFSGRHLPPPSQPDSLPRILAACGVTDLGLLREWASALVRVRRAPGRVRERFSPRAPRRGRTWPGSGAGLALPRGKPRGRRRRPWDLILRAPPAWSARSATPAGPGRPLSWTSSRRPSPTAWTRTSGGHSSRRCAPYPVPPWPCWPAAPTFPTSARATPAFSLPPPHAHTSP